jgi:hypothetical protein
MLVSIGDFGSGLKLSFLLRGFSHEIIDLFNHHSTKTGYFFDLLNTDV